MPKFSEVYDLLEKIAERLYSFLSREEVQNLETLGYLA